ncbi:MAG TPA: peptidylprolyl isomerase, partial [Ktedonobacterales bacterium]|nr:peptidylprolyl isomerase [Ktedonobacterales bacterium]
NNINSGKSKWADVAKKDSLDTTSSSNGGDLGWVVQGQQDQAIEQWAFDAKRKAGETSGVIKDVGGTFNIVQVVAIDPSRAVDSGTISTLKSNALSHWLTGMRDLAPTNHISSYNQTMYNSTYNVPTTPPFGTGASTTPTTTGGQPALPGSTSP